LGKSKSAESIEFIAHTTKDFDILVIQEVVAGPGGAYAVARLDDALDRTGADWDYCVSDPTSSSAYKTERYAFLWKKNKVKLLGKAWLEANYHLEIDREPYMATFSCNAMVFTLVNFHAITKSKQPEREIKYFRFLPSSYPALNLIFCGDFNLPESHSVFGPLKNLGYKPVLHNQKTSLKDKPFKNEYLASELDNVFYHAQKVKIVDFGVIHFYKHFNDFKLAHKISDHIPIYFTMAL
jgi:endonuclease/exonuclease/phosphatase family metal-dependent hydrolase